MAVEENRSYRAVISGYSSEGYGVARVDGGVVFVKGALQGEAVDLLVEHVGHNAAWARVERVLRSSPARLEPDCPHYQICGGCAFRHMTYTEELEAKRSRVEDAFRRIGGVNLSVSAIHGGETDHYRNKAQFPVSAGPDGPMIGFYRARSHRVVDVPDCLLQPERAAVCRRAVLDWMEAFQVAPYHEKSHTGLVRHLYLRFNQAGESLCCLVANGKGLPREEELVRRVRAACPGLAGVVLNSNMARTNVILGRDQRTLWGRSWLEDTLCGLRFRLSVPSFYQVNAPQAEILYGVALEFAGLTGQETVLDLYCGAGTISLVMAKRAKNVIGVEIVPAAVMDAEGNARRNGVDNARFWVGDAGAAAARFCQEKLRPNVVVVDPPRKGLAPEVPEVIASLGPERVVYVSCDPATLARDVKRFSALGYSPVRAAAVDMFPRTGHVETVCLLSKLRSEHYIEVDLDLGEMDLTSAESKATYEEIKAYVLEKFGLKVSSLYISQVKRKCGLEVGENYNLPKSENAKVPTCPLEKEEAIVEALLHFGMIYEY